MKKLTLFTLLIIGLSSCNDNTIDEPQCPYPYCCTCNEYPNDGPTDSPSDADPY